MKRKEEEIEGKEEENEENDGKEAEKAEEKNEEAKKEDMTNEEKKTAKSFSNNFALEKHVSNLKFFAPLTKETHTHIQCEKRSF